MKQLLKELPKIDKIAQSSKFQHCNKKLITKIAKEKINSLREDILNKKVQSFSQEALEDEILKEYKKLLSPSLKPLINATGVILHTNMGRSLISKEILDKASHVICNYSNLEYNQKEGKRGERYEHVSKHLKSLLNVEDVLVVNNNASAVFLILNTFAKGKEAIVSRGELVEIGGSFRIPEVMANSGAILKEVGATNKTKLSDYECAINENTSILMKVHKSNFSIEGFSAEVDYSQIKKLALKYNLIDYYDLGSGYIPTLPYNLSSQEEPIGNILKNNPSLISFSGDKLFGSVQAGIIAGKKELISKLKKNQLLRMLRVDKITLSILEETIKAYLEENYKQIPTLNMLFTPLDILHQRAQKLNNKIANSKVVETTTFMGGGTLPNKSFPSVALHIEGKATKLERAFRAKDIIGRIEDEKFLLDVRAIKDDDLEYIIDCAKQIGESL
jgi:L-seryl-tRNA(Ser) seleniumtransferase